MEPTTLENDEIQTMTPAAQAAQVSMTGGIHADPDADADAADR